MKLRRLGAVFCVLSTIAGLSYAVKVDMPPEQLRATATDIVVGTVLQVYERKETTADWNTTFFLAEIRVRETEKGDGIKKGDLVYVRYWTRGWVGSGTPPPGNSGHRGLPKRGDTLRIYMARNAYDGFETSSDGGLNVIGANGFEKLKE